MKLILKLTLLIVLFFTTSTSFAQFLPISYEGIFNEIVENFETINGKNSIKDGKTSLRLLSPEKIIVRMDHRKSIKTLTFIKKNDEEGEKFWVSGNSVTTDMVNKYEKTLTKAIDSLLKISRKEAKI